MVNDSYRYGLMKYVFLCAGFFTMLSCQNTNKTKNNGSITNTSLPVIDTAAEVKTGEGTSCFAYLQDRDTVMMTLHLAENAASGMLVYNIYEKDKNTGTFNGLLMGDTLLVSYSYLSEGVRSVRQVIFLVKGNVLLQGSGSMKDQNGKLVFSNRNDINFNSNILLESVDCDKMKTE